MQGNPPGEADLVASNTGYGSLKLAEPSHLPDLHSGMLLRYFNGYIRMTQMAVHRSVSDYFFHRTGSHINFFPFLRLRRENF